MQRMIEMAFIKGIDRNQKMMFPEYIEDYIKEDNSIIIIDEYVNTLDFKKWTSLNLQSIDQELQDIIQV